MLVMRICYFLILFVLSAFLPAAAPAEPVSSPAAAPAPSSAPGESEKPPAAIDFESYQRNIDDMFQIALMTNPNMDYGINSVIIDLNRKIAENPKNPNPLISLGHVYRILGQPSEANRFYEKALALDPANFHVNVFSALTAFLGEDLDKSLERLDSAVKLNPADAYARLARGRVLMMKHMDDEAIRNFEELLQFQPENRQAVFALSLLYQKKGDEKKALALLEKLREKNPDDPYIRYHLGALNLASGKPAEALKYWEGLFSSGVRDAQFLVNLSIAYLQNHEGGKAKKILDHLNFFFPDEHDVEILTAEAYRQLGRLDEAERLYRVILAEEPGNLTAAMGLADVLGLEGKMQEKDALLKDAAGRVQRQSRLAAAKKEQAERLKEVFESDSGKS